jgi:hypothetical protein
MTACREFFEKLDSECEAKESGSIRGDRLREMGADRLQRLFEWESQSASRFSPGPVESSENIRKALFQGRDVVDGSIFRNTFSSLRDLGLSGDRVEKTHDEDSKRRFSALATSGSRILYGYLDISVAHLRAMHCKENAEDKKEVSKRAIAVYDTAMQDNAAHAEAFMVIKFSNTKPQKSLEADLLEKYKDRVIRY